MRNRHERRHHPVTSRRIGPYFLEPIVDLPRCISQEIRPAQEAKIEAKHPRGDRQSEADAHADATRRGPQVWQALAPNGGAIRSGIADEAPLRWACTAKVLPGVKPRDVDNGKRELN